MSTGYNAQGPPEAWTSLSISSLGDMFSSCNNFFYRPPICRQRFSAGYSHLFLLELQSIRELIDSRSRHPAHASVAFALHYPVSFSLPALPPLAQCPQHRSGLLAMADFLHLPRPFICRWPPSPLTCTLLPTQVMGHANPLPIKVTPRSR